VARGPVRAMLRVLRAGAAGIFMIAKDFESAQGSGAYFRMVAAGRPAGQRGEGALAPGRWGQGPLHPAGGGVRWGQGPPDPAALLAAAADISLPGEAGVRSVPLADPTPLYAWSLIWLSQDRHPLLGTLLRRFAEIGLRRRWLEYDAARDWLPAHDQAELRRLEHLTARPGA